MGEGSRSEYASNYAIFDIKTPNSHPKSTKNNTARPHWDGRRQEKLAAYTLNEEPHPQVDFTWGFSNLKPAASRVST
jgi:hypothetical protein